MDQPDVPSAIGGELQSADPGPLFFLSYARAPRYHPNSAAHADFWVYKLYEDLSAEVRMLVNSPVTGFIDRGMPTGMQWSRNLIMGLATCRVFVPLYSSRYFASEHCGREWYSFSRRVLEQRARQPATEMAIVPALWIPVDEESLPSVAREIQFNHHDLGERYGQYGFFGIMKVERYRDDYMLAVQGLARRISEVASTTNIGPDRNIDFPTTESAFGEHRSSRDS